MSFSKDISALQQELDELTRRLSSKNNRHQVYKEGKETIWESDDGDGLSRVAGIESSSSSAGKK